MPLPFRVLFFLTFLAVSGAAVLYLYRRLVRDVAHQPWLRRTGAVGMVALAGGALAARAIFKGAAISQGLSLFLGLWIGLVLYTLLLLLLVDLARLATRLGRKEVPADPARRAFLARAVAGGSLLSGGALAGRGVFQAYEPPRVQEVAVRLPGLPRALEGFTVVQLSDLHIGPILQQRYVDDLVARTNALRPDLVAITGDLVDGSPAQLGGYVGRLAALRSKHGTWFCSGNHDHYAGWERWAALLTGLGVNVLRNRRVSIGDAGGSFDLLGVEDYGSRLVRTGYDPQLAAAGRDPARASVLLSHQPGTFDDAVGLGIGLQLSGHTHGGQSFPATGVASLLWGPRVAGLSREGGSQLFVSRGCGFVGPPMRLGNPSELIKVVLLPG